MKNLKRALSLVLSAAMMVGMMVVGTGAAELKDIKGHDNQEAAELMAMIGVMEGDGENFNPDNVVTRNEMAVVMCNLLDLKLNGAHPFTDVADWADKFVAAIYTNGYTAGKSATTFGGSDKITTAEAALMIMKTLGYFEFQGEFGDDWKLATVKRATELKLFENVDAGINDYLTRGEVAEMVMNALKNVVVIANERGGMSVSGNGITVTEKAEYTYAGIWNNDLDRYETLADKLYGADLAVVNYKDNDNTDDFGRPATTWTYNGGDEPVSITVADKAAIVITAEKSLKDMTKLLKDYTLAALTTTEDGEAGDEIDATVEAYKALTGNGVTVEIYADKFDVTEVVVVNEYLGKVTAITAADEDAGTERTVTVDAMEYETEDFARKDMVIYTVAAGEIKSMKLAETIEGKITAVADAYIKIDGVSYKTNAGYSYTGDFALGNTVSAYVDSFGFVIGLDEVIKTAAALEDYVVVTADNGEDNFGAQMVKVIYADGTTATLTVDAEGTDVVTEPEAGVLYTIEKTDDGYEFYTAPNATDAGYDKTVDSGKNNKDKATLGGANVADDAVIFVQNTGNGKYSVITGAALKKLATNVATIVNAYANEASTGFDTIELAYVTATTTTALDDIAYGYVVDAVEAVKNADDKTVASVKFWNGTETVTVLATESYDADLVKGDFFSYKLNNKGELSEVAEIVSGEANYYESAVTAYDGKNIKFNGTFEMTEDTVVMFVDTKNVKGVAEGEIEVADETFNDETGEAIGYVTNVIQKVDSAAGEVVVLIVDINNDMIMNEVEGAE